MKTEQVQHNNFNPYDMPEPRVGLAMQCYVIKQPVEAWQSLSLFSVQQGQLALQSCQSYYSIFSMSSQKMINKKQIFCKITLFLILH